MTILVDTQHRPGHSGDMAPALRRLITPSSLVEEAYLEHGDAVLTGNGPHGSAIRVGYEVKRAADALQCISDGRFAGLGGQLEGMHRDYDLCWLVLLDDLRPDSQTGVLMRKLPAVYGGRARSGGRGRRGKRPAGGDAGRWVQALFGAKRAVRYADLTNWLTSVQIQSMEEYKRPLFVWRVSTAMELAQWLAGQYRYWTGKPYEQHKSLHMFNTALWDKSEGVGRRRGGIGFVSELTKKRAGFLARLDGVGYERAMNLARRFSSIYAAVNAEEEELMVGAREGRRDGVGKRLAKSVYTQIREEEKRRERKGG